MNFAKLLTEVPAAYAAAEELARFTRLARRRRLAERAGYAALGAALGFGISLLVTPRRGAQARRHLAERFSGFLDGQPTTTNNTATRAAVGSSARL